MCVIKHSLVNGAKAYLLLNVPVLHVQPGEPQGLNAPAAEENAELYSDCPVLKNKDTNMHTYSHKMFDIWEAAQRSHIRTCVHLKAGNARNCKDGRLTGLLITTGKMLDYGIDDCGIIFPFNYLHLCLFGCKCVR